MTMIRNHQPVLSMSCNLRTHTARVGKNTAKCQIAVNGCASRRSPGGSITDWTKITAMPTRVRNSVHWRNEGGQAGREIKRIAVAYEAGRDGFWQLCG